MTTKSVWIAIALATLSFGATAGGEPPRKSDQLAQASSKAQRPHKGDGKTPLIDKSSRAVKTVDAKECKNNPGSACLIPITVNERCKETPQGNVKPDPEYLFIRKKGRVTIVWKIETAGWSFDEKEGIKFKDGQSEITAGERLANDVWASENKGQTIGLFKYGIKVTNGSVTCVLDPGVVNDWGG